MKIILPAFLLFCLSYSKGQTFTKSIERNSEGLGYFNIYPGSNGNYYVAGVDSGEVYVIKFNNSHDTLWTRSFKHYIYNSVNLIETNNNGCAILAFDNGSVMNLIRFDSLGIVNLSKSYEASGHNLGSDFIQTGDSCFLLCAPVTHIGNPSYYYNQLVKVDQNGDTVWTKEIPSNFYSFDILEQGTDLYFSGRIGGLFKTDKDGLPSWSLAIPAQFSRMGIPKKFIGVRSDTLFLIGNFGLNSNSDSSAMILYDTSGTFLDAVFIPGYNIIDGSLSNDGGVALALENATSDTSLLVRLDENFNISTCTGIREPSGQFLKVIQLLVHNNSYLICGNYLDLQSSLYKCKLILTDSVGNSACSTFNANCNSININIDSYIMPTGYSYPSAYMYYDSQVIVSSLKSIKINTDCISTSIDVIESDKLTLFPNPTNNFVEINSIDKKANIEVYNMLGNLIEKFDDLELPGRLNIHEYPKGIYLISIDGFKYQSVFKVIVF